jgi:hypothetical protein
MERREPGREVDLIGHSQGGVIMAEFLLHVYHPSDPAYPPLGFAVAMGSPLGGDTGASVEGTLNGSAVGRLALNAAHTAGAPDPNAQSVADLNKGSELVRELDPSRLPPEVVLTSIGATQDVIAPAVDTARRGAQSFTVTPHSLNGHSGIVTDDSALRATRAAIEGKHLPCQSLTTIMAGEIVSTAIATAERRIGDIGKLVAGATAG